MSKKVKIAVTGVGGGVGQSVIKSLDQTDYDIVGLDGELLGTGLYAVPSSYLIPYANSPEYIPRVLEICEKEECKLLFPGLDAELKVLALHKDTFASIGTNVVVSSPDVIDISDDKQITYDKLKSFGISVPLTLPFEKYASNPSQVDFPLIVKQQVGGARSKNVFFIKNQTDLENLVSEKDFVTSNYVVQQFIEGDEYTCGTINWEGQCRGVIVMRRILRDGDTYKCFSVKNEIVETEVLKVMNAIQPFGACNVQLRMKDGKPYIFEINARCSGTTSSRTLCGFNEPKMIADYLLKGIEPQYTIKEVTILRYWKELMVKNEEVIHMKNSQHLTSYISRHL
jgi:carbamoyl-phosphate synthase large subunit